MNKKLFYIFLSSLFVIASYGQSNLGFTNLDNTSNGGSGIFNSSGNLIPFGQGSVQVGFFDGITDSEIVSLYASGNLSTLSSSFQPWNASPVNMNVDPGAPGLFGEFVSKNVSDDPPLNTIFIGQNIYLWASTGGSDFTDPGSEYLIYSWATPFPFNNNNAEVFLRDGQGTLLVGQFGNFSNDYGMGSGVQAGFNTVEVVPEPATYATLIGLLALGIVVTRRARR
jgi:hypothetical protein